MQGSILDEVQNHFDNQIKHMKIKRERMESKKKSIPKEVDDLEDKNKKYKKSKTELEEQIVVAKKKNNVRQLRAWKKHYEDLMKQNEADHERLKEKLAKV